MKRKSYLAIIFLVLPILLGTSILSVSGLGLQVSVTYSGYVKNTSGQALNGAYVALYDAGNNKIKGVYSGSDGSYSLTASVDRMDILTLKASKSGYITQSKSVPAIVLN